MKASIIIPVYNQLPEVLKLLQSLSSSTPLDGNEFIFVDDCSSEFDLRTLLGPPIKVIRNDRNFGFGATCNVGSQRASGDILVFLNSDIVVSQNWLQPILDLFDNPEIGIVGPKLVFPPWGDKYLVQSCGGDFDALKNPFHRYLGWDSNDWRVNQVEEVNWITGAALAIRRKDFIEMGGFNLSFVRAYFEDVDLCLRMRQAGKKVYYQPNSTLMHAVGKSTADDSVLPQKTFRYNLTLFHKLWDDLIVPGVNTVMVNF